jgi:LacI family fructose operon transcriptional repressor
VVLDNERMAAVLVEHLHAWPPPRGRPVWRDEHHRPGTPRRVRAAAAALGLEAQAIAVPHGRGGARVAGLLSGPGRPDALVASNGIMLLRSCAPARDVGAGDMALAGFDNNDWMDFVGQGGAGGISVIEQPVEEIGRTATAMLLDRLDNPDAPTRKVVLAGKLVARG